MDFATLLLLILLGIGLLGFIFRGRGWAPAPPAIATGPHHGAGRPEDHAGVGSSPSDTGRHASRAKADDDGNQPPGGRSCC